MTTSLSRTYYCIGLLTRAGVNKLKYRMDRLLKIKISKKLCSTKTKLADSPEAYYFQYRN